MFEYQKTGRFFAQCAGNSEEFAARELKEFGAKEIIPAYRGVWFVTDLEHLYRINYRARLITRVLATLISFDCHSEKYLYKIARELDWNEIMSPENTFAVFATVSNSNINHSHYSSLLLKDAIVDYFKDTKGTRPSVDTENPDIWINLHIEQNRARISLDTSGGSLHRRGYRVATIDAPMIETLAATMVRISDWNGDKPLWDPMCGSGTILAEALLHYCRIPSAFRRDNFGFEYLPDFDKTLWESIKKDSSRLARKLPPDLISGSDINTRACFSAMKNINTLPDGINVSVKNMDFRDHSGLENGVIITNPPFGVRMGDNDSVAKLYKDFGDFLKHKCKGSTAFVYIGNRELIPSLGLKPSAKTPLVNGNLDGRLVKLEMY